MAYSIGAQAVILAFNPPSASSRTSCIFGQVRIGAVRREAHAPGDYLRGGTSPARDRARCGVRRRGVRGRGSGRVTARRGSTQASLARAARSGRRRMQVAPRMAGRRPGLRLPPAADRLHAGGGRASIVHTLAASPRPRPGDTAARRAAASRPARGDGRRRPAPPGRAAERRPPAPGGAAPGRRAARRLPPRRGPIRVRWQVLAAVNLVESGVRPRRQPLERGRPRPDAVHAGDVAGVRPGGDIRARRDAILGAANYLHRSGAPRRAAGALRLQPLDALRRRVLAYARVMTATRSGSPRTTPGRRACRLCSDGLPTPYDSWSPRCRNCPPQRDL